MSCSQFNGVMYSFIKNQNKELNYFQYGFSMKATALRLANNFLIISKTSKEVSIGMISIQLQKKLKEKDKNNDFILTPIVNYRIEKIDYVRSQVLLARQGDNVMIESGGITWLYNPEFYPYPTAIRRIREAAEWVGMDRLRWGSDYPRTITAITYRMSYDFVVKSNEFTDTEKKMFLGENAKRFYGF